MYTTLLDALEIAILTFQYCLPVVCVFRWDLIGVLLGTIIVQVGIILLDSMLLIDPRATWQDKFYEDWQVLWISGLTYCLLLLGLKWGLKCGAKWICLIDLDWFEPKSRK